MFGAYTEGEDNNHPGRALASEIREKTVTGIEIAGIFFLQISTSNPGLAAGLTA